jgi:UDP-2-acetamido-2,6-beta-L-arabino-hexul-4-ose reductase
MKAKRTIVVTGADGFVGKNLMLRLRELDRFEPVPLTRTSSEADWAEAIARADAVIHLAGVNRPQQDAEFRGNRAAAESLVAAIEGSKRQVPVIHASSVKALEPTAYGESKKDAEDSLLAFARRNGNPAAVFRLPNVFGKWCRPNYNSAVATFCHNVARGLPIAVNDPAAPITLLYVDDLIDMFLALLDAGGFETGYYEASPTYETSVGEVAGTICRFRDDRASNLIDDVGAGLTRALYATYVSYLPPEEFSYELKSHRDPRGAFSEMLKTRQAGQFSYFNALPGVTRGGHYHHSKTEKFLIVHGEARFRFRHMLTGETREIRTSAETPVVVETIPGWAHDVTNVGESVMVSLLWANEIFDRERPDTIAATV